MTIEDYIISLLLMASIVRQLRGRPLTWLGLTWPIGLVIYAGFKYLAGITATGNNLLLVIVLAGVGAGLGLTCGRLSRVYVEDEQVKVRSSGLAALLWIIGIGIRIAFGLFAANGGAATIVHLSAWAHINGLSTWSTALILMSLLEVLARTAQLIPRLVENRQLVATADSSRERLGP